MAYTLSYNKSSVDEGNNVIITLDGSGLPDGSLVPFTLTGTNISASDFLGLTSLSGNFLIQSGRGRIVLVIGEDFKTEGNETFILSLDGRPESIAMIINDTSVTPPGALAEFYITSTQPTVNEGQTLSFYISAVNVPAGTAVPYEVFGIQQNDLVSGFVTGSLVFQANSAIDTSVTLSLGIAEDFKTESNETAVLLLKPTFAYSLKITNTIIVRDTSRENAPNYKINLDRSTIFEGESVKVTITATNVNAGEILKWKLIPTNFDANPTDLNPVSDITFSDFTGLSSFAGTFPPLVETAQGNVANVVFVTRDDYIYEQSEYFYISGGDDDSRVPSQVIKVLDSGNTLVQSDSTFSGNVIVKFIEPAVLQANTGAVVTNAGYWKNTKSHPDDQMVIQGRRLYEDETAEVYYQPFSYVIRSSQSIDVWKNYVKEILHPAGFSFFSEINNETDTNNVNYAGVKGAVTDSEIITYSPITMDGIKSSLNTSISSITVDTVYTAFNNF